MSEKKVKGARGVVPVRAAGAGRSAEAAVPEGLDRAAEFKVSLVAENAGLAGGGLPVMAQTWLKRVVEVSGGGGEGLSAACGAVNFLGSLMAGDRTRDALKASKLTWGDLVMFMEASPEFEKVLAEAYRIRKKLVALKKEAMGDEVLTTAYELATEGEEQYNNKTGLDLGFKKKSEKMLDRLLVLSGQEFRKDGLVMPGSTAAGGGGVGGITLNFHFDGKGRPDVSEVVDV